MDDELAEIIFKLKLLAHRATNITPELIHSAPVLASDLKAVALELEEWAMAFRTLYYMPHAPHEPIR